MVSLKAKNDKIKSPSESFFCHPASKPVYPKGELFRFSLLKHRHSRKIATFRPKNQLTVSDFYTWSIEKCACMYSFRIRNGRRTKTHLWNLHDVLLAMRIELKMRRHVGNSIVRSCNFLGFDGLMLPTHLFIFSPFGGAMSFESANVYKFVETTKNRRRPIHLWSTTDTFPLF